MTGTDIENRVRVTLQDNFGDSSKYRWTNAEFLRILNDGLQELYHKRPDAFYLNSVIVDPPDDLTALTETIPMLDRYRDTIQDFMLYRLYQKNTDEGSQDRAHKYKQAFDRGMR